LQKQIDGQRFALVELILVALCGAAWVIKPEWGIWFILTALLPFALRIVSGRFVFDGRDWLVLVFGITAWVGYWAAYDQTVAWNKAWLVVTAVLMYFSLKSQPKQNLIWVSVFLFCIGVGVSLYYFLTHDFVALPRKLEFVNQFGRWIMGIRPQVGWTPIHSNYVAGMVAVTVPFILYPVWSFRKRNVPLPVFPWLVIGIGLGFAVLALVMATSRGVVFAILSGAGGWLLWRSIYLTGISRRIKSEAVFPILLLVYLCAVVLFLYAGPARSNGISPGNDDYGDGSRGELFARSLYLLQDYPITGGGLGSFPGLYSHYLLGIPYFNVPNSHNLFLDVGIEQGLFGGFSFFLLYLAGLWTISNAIAREHEDQIFKWIMLFSLIVAFVHGMVDNYLYNGAGTALSLFLVGLSIHGQGYDETRRRRFYLRTVSVIVLILAFIAVVNLNQIRAIWNANLGAVRLAKEELAGFPDTGWAGDEIVPRLDAADASLRTSLQFDPANRTANHRLGLINMLRWDFDSASGYLETAHKQAPEHRGIIKSLAYCHVWLGDMVKAEFLLSEIPEASDEMDVYVWWWGTQGRDDLSANASVMASRLESATLQP
jgi:O-antigen ligase